MIKSDLDQKKSINFPAKILLFGEYIVLDGGSCVSIPYPEYSISIRTNQGETESHIKQFAAYIDTLDVFKNRISKQFLQDIQKGISFQSNIPIGYGLGSSGAIVALIYHNYLLDPATDYIILKNELGLLESYFHQKSSGIDPLTSYLQKAICIQNDLLTIDNLWTNTIKYELVDSNTKRNAKKAIDLFLESKQNESFSKNWKKLCNLNQLLVSNLSMNYFDKQLMVEYSNLQLQLMSPWIVDSIRDQWLFGLNSSEYSMKLCGAGMGGMYLKIYH